jgi:hypothetical protein
VISLAQDVKSVCLELGLLRYDFAIVDVVIALKDLVDLPLAVLIGYLPDRFLLLRILPSGRFEIGYFLFGIVV